MDPIKETAENVETKPAAGLPDAASIASANIEPGTEGAPHTGQIEPHSPAANTLPSAGASGVVHEPTLGSLGVTAEGSNTLELPVQASVESISSDHGLPKNQHPNDVRFRVKYAANFKGEKTFEDGSVQVISKESAAQFTKLGIGSIIK